MGTAGQGLIHKWIAFVKMLPISLNQLIHCLIYFYIKTDAVESKVGLVHENDFDWFLTLNKIHHEFSTMGTPIIPKVKGEMHCSSNFFHMIGVYGTTHYGEPMLPLYILSMALLHEEDCRIDPHVCRVSPKCQPLVGVGSCRSNHHQFALSTRAQWTQDCGINLFMIFILHCLKGIYCLYQFTIQ